MVGYSPKQTLNPNLHSLDGLPLLVYHYFVSRQILILQLWYGFITANYTLYIRQKALLRNRRYLAIQLILYNGVEV